MRLTSENSVSEEYEPEEYTGLLGQFDFTSGGGRERASEVKSGITISRMAIGNLESEYFNDALALSDWVSLNVGAGKWLGFEINSAHGYEYEVDSVLVIMRRSDNTPDRIRLSYGDDKQNTTQIQGVITEVGSSVYETYPLEVNASQKPDQSTPYYAIGVQAGSRETVVEFDRIAIYGKVNEVLLPTSGDYIIHFDQPQQIIEGLGVELQSDRMGPDYVNSDPVNGVPYELTSAEKQRLAEKMTGFRYIRLAMGLWFRGTTPDNKNIVERYPGQLQSIKDLITDAGIEGISMEYWSPAPYWKSTDSYLLGSLKSFDSVFLSDFGDAVVGDISYLTGNGLTISTWGLQNEPFNDGLGYSQCDYIDGESYYKAFKAVAPKVRAALPNTEIIVDSHNGNLSRSSSYIRGDAQTLNLVDSWVYHRGGASSDLQIEGQSRFLPNNMGKPIYQNEYSYHAEHVEQRSKEWRMVNIAQSVMNWMTFLNSPKWYWLHILKPTNDPNREGFGLGVYRPLNDNNFNNHPDVAQGTFKLSQHYNGIAGFLEHMPWDSRRYEVEEDEVLYNQRIMAWKRPDGKFVFALTNRSSRPFEFNIAMDQPRSFTGYRYDKDTLNQTLPSQSGSDHTITLEPWSIEFWVED
ncbi:glycoside hydrolase [Sinomicrobium soli]|uniref:hypothetical protein n=1 Tax=Sinomicrobium sp. N-1-3-6 TaxID=2219864 RepID=UPI000DCD1B6D|nr:hypothetical protein [Sinomicrobium sp. N-1-3-6]RAV29577.1 hypothetical protein DN748_08810 [Sinomicrobium sp. N-1-3-6]